MSRKPLVVMDAPHSFVQHYSGDEASLDEGVRRADEARRDAAYRAGVAAMDSRQLALRLGTVCQVCGLGRLAGTHSDCAELVGGEL